MLDGCPEAARFSTLLTDLQTRPQHYAARSVSWSVIGHGENKRLWHYPHDWNQQLVRRGNREIIHCFLGPTTRASTPKRHSATTRLDFAEADLDLPEARSSPI